MNSLQYPILIKTQPQRTTQEMVCLSSCQRGTAQHGWAWHREPDHLADANCDVRRCLGRGPQHSGTEASGGYHQSHEQKALNFTALHQHLYSSPLCRGGGPCRTLWSTHTNAHTQVHVCARAWRQMGDEVVRPSAGGAVGPCLLAGAC